MFLRMPVFTIVQIAGGPSTLSYAWAESGVAGYDGLGTATFEVSKDYTCHRLSQFRTLSLRRECVINIRFHPVPVLSHRLTPFFVDMSVFWRVTVDRSVRWFGTCWHSSMKSNERQLSKLH